MLAVLYDNLGSHYSNGGGAGVHGAHVCGFSNGRKYHVANREPWIGPVSGCFPNEVAILSVWRPAVVGSWLVFKKSSLI